MAESLICHVPIQGVVTLLGKVGDCGEKDFDSIFNPFFSGEENTN